MITWLTCQEPIRDFKRKSRSSILSLSILLVQPLYLIQQVPEGQNAVYMHQRLLDWFGRSIIFSLHPRTNEILQEHASSKSIPLKSMSSICWSARNEVVKVLKLCFHKILEALAYFESSTDEKPFTRNEAAGLCQHLERLESAFMLTIKVILLDCFDLASG